MAEILTLTTEIAGASAQKKNARPFAMLLELTNSYRKCLNVNAPSTRS
jgi:hypothetical protein